MHHSIFFWRSMLRVSRKSNDDAHGSSSARASVSVTFSLVTLSACGVACRALSDVDEAITCGACSSVPRGTDTSDGVGPLSDDVVTAFGQSLQICLNLCIENTGLVGQCIQLKIPYRP